jgi:glycosyltransferase involved in cell wall biosynthesis
MTFPTRSPGAKNFKMKVADRVTVICIAYNHEKWIEETLESVRIQDYYAKELIIIDNGSTDQTPENIRHWVSQRSGNMPVKTIFLEKEMPYCGVFNESLKTISSQYIVDLSGDDVLYPDHLSLSIEQLRRAPNAAFVYSDAYILSPDGEVKTFYKRDSNGELAEEIVQGDVYEALIEHNYICSPTIVFNAKILEKIGGYDSSLYYEDFDIQLRLAREYPAVFSDHIGVLKRQHSKSLSSNQYQRYKSMMLPSTLIVCEKIKEMNIYPEENIALGKRILFELKHALWSANFEPAEGFVKLGEEIGLKGIKFSLYKFWLKKRYDISWLYLQLT